MSNKKEEDCKEEKKELEKKVKQLSKETVEELKKIREDKTRDNQTIQK